MMDACNQAGLKVMVDIVPNHSSDDHVWFQEALKSPIGSAARDRFIFRDGMCSLLRSLRDYRAKLTSCRSWRGQVATAFGLGLPIRRLGLGARWRWTVVPPLV